MLSLWRTLPERLSRITTGGKIISEIDGFRFLAIFPVVVNHLSQRIQRHSSIQFDPSLETDPFFCWISRGYVGIYVFFVISGFILSLPFASYCLHQGREVKLKDYFVRRLTRLEPPYIIAMTVFFVVLLLQHASFQELLPHYGASIVYLHNLIYKIWSPINPVAWTLEVEVQFYILAPFLAYAFFSIKDRWTRRGALIAFILILVCIQQYFGWMKYPWSFFIISHLHFFIIGFLLTDFYLSEWKETGRKPLLLFDVLAIIGIVGIFVLISFNFVNRLFYPVALFFLFYGTFRSHHVLKFFRNRWIVSIGGMCYTIYLLHLPMAELFERVVGHIGVTNHYVVNLIIQLPFYLLFVFGISVVFFLLVEKPCMNKDWPRLLWARISKR